MVYFSGSALVSINKVTLHQAWLLLVWVTIYGGDTISVPLTSHTGELSFLP